MNHFGNVAQYFNQSWEKVNKLDQIIKLHELLGISTGWKGWMISQPCFKINTLPLNKVHGVNIGPIWGLQDRGGPHVGPMNFAIWACAN